MSTKKELSIAKALYIAVEHGYIDAVKCFYPHVNKIGQQAAFVSAATYGYLNIVKYLESFKD